MKIKELIKNNAGFQYVIDNMELLSSAGRRVMLNTTFSTDPTAITDEWQRLALAIEATQRTDTKRAYTDLRHCLMQLHDLQASLAALAAHTTLNEVELFEIKNLSNLTNTARRAIEPLGLTPVLPLPDLSEVFTLLDPDSTGITNFYIYDSYDPRLAPLRRELNALQQHTGDPGRISQLLAEQNHIQNHICTTLSDRLHPWAKKLSETLEQMAYADFLLAKADLCVRWHLARPRLSHHTLLRALWNPRLKHRNEQLGTRYQPIDIHLTDGVTLITGANMAGKTVLLKSIATAQLMAQCGMYVPAESADITVFENIAFSIGDEQNEMNGLSSYASEIIKISDIVAQSRKCRLLALIDEPARTTNPTEGKALVQALINIMEQTHSSTLITTHYDKLHGARLHLRVKGFIENMDNSPITPQNINRFIDYSLAEDRSDNVPREALRIATILGCDPQLVSIAQENLGK